MKTQRHRFLKLASKLFANLVMLEISLFYPLVWHFDASITRDIYKKFLKLHASLKIL